MDVQIYVKELIEKVAALQVELANLKAIVTELKTQQWFFITAIIGFLGKEIWHQFKNNLIKKK